MKTDGEWADAYARAYDFVSQLTLTEKVNLTTGTGYARSFNIDIGRLRLTAIIASAWIAA